MSSSTSTKVLLLRQRRHLLEVVLGGGGGGEGAGGRRGEGESSFHNNQVIIRECIKFVLEHIEDIHCLVGLVVKASASRAEDPGFESRLHRDFLGVESYQ